MPELPAGRTASSRRYDDQEVARLLERAAELQRAGPVSAATGLTLAELESVAAEAGLDVAALRQAAAELDVGGGAAATTGTRLAGAPLRLRFERSLPFEVPDDAFDRLLPIVQETVGVRSQVTQAGRSWSWQASDPESSRRLEVIVAVHGGETTIRIEERFGHLAGGLFGGVLGGFGGVSLGLYAALASTVGASLLVAAVPVGVVAGTYTACRFGFRSLVRRRESVLRRLLDRIADELSTQHPQ